MQEVLCTQLVLCVQCPGCSVNSAELSAAHSDFTLCVPGALTDVHRPEVINYIMC